MDIKCMSQSTKKRMKPNRANPCMASSSKAIAGWGRVPPAGAGGHGGSGSSRLARRTSGLRMAGAHRDGSNELGLAGSEAGLRAGVKENWSLSGAPVSTAVRWWRMFRLTATRFTRCRSPDPAAKSADEAGQQGVRRARHFLLSIN